MNAQHDRDPPSEPRRTTRRRPAGPGPGMWALRVAAAAVIVAAILGLLRLSGGFTH